MRISRRFWNRAKDERVFTRPVDTPQWLYVMLLPVTLVLYAIIYLIDWIAGDLPQHPEDR